MMIKFSAIPSGLEDNIFKPEELAFDNFISYILSKMREGEKLKTSIKELREKVNLSAAQLAYGLQDFYVVIGLEFHSYGISLPRNSGPSLFKIHKDLYLICSQVYIHVLICG